LAKAFFKGLFPTHEGPDRITKHPFRSSAMGI
jgi:hypothetical protein